MRNNEAQRETRKRDKMEREMKQTKADLDSKNSEIKTMQTQIQRYKEDIIKLEQQLKEQRVGSYWNFKHLSHIMRNLTVCICENKGCLKFLSGFLCKIFSF